VKPGYFGNPPTEMFCTREKCGTPNRLNAISTGGQNPLVLLVDKAPALPSRAESHAVKYELQQKSARDIARERGNAKMQ
jgi:hypothetical protein